MTIPAIYRLLHSLRHIVFRRLARSRIALVAFLFLAMWLTSATLFYYSEHIVAGRKDIDFVASLYWSIITMATVGYGDITPTRGLGWAVAAATAVMGIAVYTLTISLIADEFMELSMRRSLGLAPLKGKKILVIGGSDACWDLVDELVANGLGKETGWLIPEKPASEPPVDYLVGDPMKRDDLVKAGVGKAERIVLCLGDDSKTLHVALAVRRLNHRARLAAVAMTGEAEELLREAGVDHVVSSRLLGRTLASAIFEPSVAWFIEEAVSVRGVADVAEEPVPDWAVGLTIEEAEKKLSESHGLRMLVLGIVELDGRVVLAPERSRRLERGQRLLLLKVRGNE